MVIDPLANSGCNAFKGTGFWLVTGPWFSSLIGKYISYPLLDTHHYSLSFKKWSQGKMSTTWLQFKPIIHLHSIRLQNQSFGKILYFVNTYFWSFDLIILNSLDCAVQPEKFQYLKHFTKILQFKTFVKYFRF